jgi:peroxiredoxin
MNLTVELEKTLNDFKEQAPQKVQNEMQKAYEELSRKKVGSDSLSINDTFPDFELINQNNSKVTLDELLKESNYLLITFYRGGWCPYCNLELRALQEKLPELNVLGTNLVAITPERPDQSLSTAEKNELNFSVLSDINSELSSKIGISFELPENLKPIYYKFGIDIPKHNGDNNFTLPVPATYLIDKKKNVLLSFKDVDYTVRLNPEDIINQLEKLQI